MLMAKKRLVGYKVLWFSRSVGQVIAAIARVGDITDYQMKLAELGASKSMATQEAHYKQAKGWFVKLELYSELSCPQVYADQATVGVEL